MREINILECMNSVAARFAMYILMYVMAFCIVAQMSDLSEKGSNLMAGHRHCIENVLSHLEKVCPYCAHFGVACGHSIPYKALFLGHLSPWQRRGHRFDPGRVHH